MSDVIAWVMGHSAIMAGLVIAIIDFLIEVIPGLKSNSLISLLLSVLKKKDDAPPSA